MIDNKLPAAAGTATPEKEQAATPQKKNVTARQTARRILNAIGTIAIYFSVSLALVAGFSNCSSQFKTIDCNAPGVVCDF